MLLCVYETIEGPLARGRPPVQELKLQGSLPLEGSEVHETGNRKIFFKRTGLCGTRKKDADREEEKERNDPVAGWRALAADHGVCDNSFGLTEGPLFS